MLFMLKSLDMHAVLAKYIKHIIKLIDNLFIKAYS